MDFTKATDKLDILKPILKSDIPISQKAQTVALMITPFLAMVDEEQVREFLSDAYTSHIMTREPQRSHDQFEAVEALFRVTGSNQSNHADFINQVRDRRLVNSINNMQEDEEGRDKFLKTLDKAITELFMRSDINMEQTKKEDALSNKLPLESWIMIGNAFDSLFPRTLMQYMLHVRGQEGTTSAQRTIQQHNVRQNIPMTQRSKERLERTAAFPLEDVQAWARTTVENASGEKVLALRNHFRDAVTEEAFVESGVQCFRAIKDFNAVAASGQCSEENLDVILKVLQPIIDTAKFLTQAAEDAILKAGLIEEDKALTEKLRTLYTPKYNQKAPSPSA